MHPELISQVVADSLIVMDYTAAAILFLVGIMGLILTELIIMSEDK